MHRPTYICNNLLLGEYLVAYPQGCKYTLFRIYMRIIIYSCCVFSESLLFMLLWPKNGYKSFPFFSRYVSLKMAL